MRGRQRPLIMGIYEIIFKYDVFIDGSSQSGRNAEHC